MIGPITSTWNRCHLPLDRNSSAAPVRASSGFSPAIFTYPPSGIALMQYSVPPRLTLTSFGPKPSENVSTRTPMRRAIRKCPSSCTKISTPRTNRKARVLVTSSPGGSRRRLYPTRRARGVGSGPAVDLPHIVEAANVPVVGLLEDVHRVANDLRDGGEGKTLAEKRRHRHLVCRVENYG